MSDSSILDTQHKALYLAGQAANQAAARNIFAEYQSRRSARTLIIQQTNLDHFTDFLMSVQAAPIGNLCAQVDAWAGITYGLIEAFRHWLLRHGYAIRTVNLAVSNIKVYANLAFKAGVIPESEHALIRTITSYSRQEGKAVNQRRQEAGLGTRFNNAKKAEATTLSVADARRLKRDHDLTTGTGRRDCLLMSLLIDFGLRCSEVVDLKVGDVNLTDRTLMFYRRKVDKTQTFELTGDVWHAVRAYFEAGDAPAARDAPLLRASRKGGRLTEAGMSERAITGRVRYLGRQLLAIENLSPHDCRHTGATLYSRKGVDVLQLRDWGGWNSLAMPAHYIEGAKIANEGMDSI